MKSLPFRRATVRVPASSANLGPGFDALGLAVALYNTVIAEPSSHFELLITGEGAGELPTDRTNATVRALDLVCSLRGITPPPMKLSCHHEVPTARGLGSSSCALVAGLLLGNSLLEVPFTPAELAQLAAQQEGHPDNVTPALFGGLQVSVLTDEGTLVRVPVPLPRVTQLAVFIPDRPLPTKEARAVLPATLTRAECVFTLSRAALLVAALATGTDEALAVATQDVLHQKPRTKLFPEMPALFEAARQQGAVAAWLSGAGSTIAALVRQDGEGVAEAMRLRAAELGLSGRAKVVQVDTVGATCTIERV